MQVPLDNPVREALTVWVTSDKGGRPPIGRPLTVRLDEADRQQLEALAEDREIPVAELVRIAVRQYLKGES